MGDRSRPPAFATPTYCPLCLKAGPPDATLCPHCGETLVDQGHCGVCERFWKLPVGDDCPKHDIALSRIHPGSVATPDFSGWVSVASYNQPLSAEAPRIRLEAEGIPTFLDGRHVGGHGMYEFATGGVKLQVPRHLADEARILLSQSWRTESEDEDDLDDAWDDLAPEPWSRMRSAMKVFIVLILLLPLLRMLIGLLGR